MKVEILAPSKRPRQVRTLLVPCRRADLRTVIELASPHVAAEPAVLGTDFRGHKETWRYLYPSRGSAPFRRLVLLGLGDEATSDSCRKGVRHFVYQDLAALDGQLAIDLEEWGGFAVEAASDPDRFIAACIEGCLLGSHALGSFKTDKAIQSSAEKDKVGKRLDLLQVFVSKKRHTQTRTAASRSLAVALSQRTAIQLVDAPSNELTPRDLAQVAARSAKAHGFKVEVLGKKELEKLGMGGILAVNQGSSLPPVLIVMEYRPPKKGRCPKIGLVGKGVTFDTGGISIKPSLNLSHMKGDMAGAAAVLGAVEAAARLKLPVHVVAAIPATDNKPDAAAQNPGDVIRTYSGITVEVEDTDAEGRLILADALAYLNQRHRPDLIVDLATLTGACYVALGDHAAGLFTDNDRLAARLEQAGTRSDEPVWRLPLWKDYDTQIESDVADLKNFGGRGGGAITAARFLQRFVDSHPAWAHLDIAGVAFRESKFARFKHATGYGVRLLAELMVSLSEKPL